MVKSTGKGIAIGDSGSCSVTGCISIVVVTSPTPSMPCTALIDACIDSFKYINGLELSSIYIIMDGYKVCPTSRTKRGKTTEEMAIRYEEYHSALLEKYTDPRFTIVKAKQHMGFAHAVRMGLELCTTTYAMIAQHDRVFFDCHFNRLDELIEAMERDHTIRYIGFPTQSNASHDKLLSIEYKLYCLNSSAIKRHLGGDLYLQPIIFWFDSQHLCHVQRYLEIYKPYKNFPLELRPYLQRNDLKDMLLRPGDFVEDRFGQVQRRILCQMAAMVAASAAAAPTKPNAPAPPAAVLVSDGPFADEATAESDHEISSVRIPPQSSFVGGNYGIDDTDNPASGTLDLLNSTTVSIQGKADNPGTNMPAVVQRPLVIASIEPVSEKIIMKVFRWFGSYLCWQCSSQFPYEVQCSSKQNDTLVMVGHLKGRQSDATEVMHKLQQSKQHRQNPYRSRNHSQPCEKPVVAAAVSTADSACEGSDDFTEQGQMDKL